MHEYTDAILWSAQVRREEWFREERENMTKKIRDKGEICIAFIWLDLFLFVQAFTGFESNNKYKICNSMGQQVYFAAEGKYH